MKILSVEVKENVHLPWPDEDSVIVAIGNIAGVTHNKDDTEYQTCFKRVMQCIKSGHHSVLEHTNLSIDCTVDRGTSHALVRHRHCAVTQESTLYSKYKDDCAFIALPTTDPITDKAVGQIDVSILDKIEFEYHKLLKEGVINTLARDILPNCLATRLVITTNIREWWHIIQLRKSLADSVRMHCFAYQLNKLLCDRYPNITGALTSWSENGSKTL